MLHDGPAKTREIEAVLNLGAASDEYRFRLIHAAGDTLAVIDESVRWQPLEANARPGAPFRLISASLRRWPVHQFSDTSSTSRIRNKWSVDDGVRLKEDAANLAPFLYRLQEYQPKYYQRIVETIRLILPFFADFELQPEFDSILPRWLERGTDRVFGVSQAADGMLRAMALVALLRQPEEDLPDILILDEPELGLHPYAIELLGAMQRSVSHHVQVIVATQSVSLVDRFEPDDIVVVDRVGRESIFRRLKDADLAEWREDYTLSELWEKNVLGGRPGR